MRPSHFTEVFKICTRLKKSNQKHVDKSEQSGFVEDTLTHGKQCLVGHVFPPLYQALLKDAAEQDSV